MIPLRCLLGLHRCDGGDGRADTGSLRWCVRCGATFELHHDRVWRRAYRYRFGKWHR